jgi:membrane fusion protein (multidrug efflux system)
MVVDGDGKVAVRPVRVTHAIGDKWLVDEGLRAGDRVIVEGLQKIRPGMPVKPIEAAPAAPLPAAPAAAPATPATAPSDAAPARAAPAADKR